MLGLGEAGGRIAADLVAAGVEVRGFDPTVVGVPEGVVRTGDPASAVAGGSVVLAATTAATARAAAESVLTALGPDAVYADMNTASPALKRELAVLVEGSGARFADIGLLGPGPRDRHSCAGIRHRREGVRRADRAARDAGRGGLRAGGRRRGDEAPALGVHEGSGRVRDREPRGRRVRRGTRSGWSARSPRSSASRFSGGCSRAASGMRCRRVDEMEAACELLVDLGVEPRIARASASLLAGLAERSAAGA